MLAMTPIRIAQPGIGIDALDAVSSEVVDSPGEERGAGVGALVIEDLGVGESTVVIDE